MNIVKTKIPDVLIIEPLVFYDERGFFLETWNRMTFKDEITRLEFVQDNYSQSKQHILRGLHYQIKKAQGKLVQCTRGVVYDVVVDLRKKKETFGQWVGIILSEENKRMLWVPPGFGHGFYVISDLADFRYKCTDYYAPQNERCILWDDPDLKIEWPIPKGVFPIISKKDAVGDFFANAIVY